MRTAATLTLFVIVGLYMLPRKSMYQSEWLRGVKDAEAAVQAQGLKVTVEYFDRETLAWEFGAYERGWQSYLLSAQAK